MKKPIDKLEYTFGDRAADFVANSIGAWRTIIIQSILIVVWIIGNVIGVFHFDPYPFILMNLMLSLQAAYTGPVLLMSGNRQAELDRHEAKLDAIANREALSGVKSVQEDMAKVLNRMKDLEHTSHHILSLLKHVHQDVEPGVKNDSAKIQDGTITESIRTITPGEERREDSSEIS